MKKRKILYVIPFAALVLSGCSFQDGVNWIGKNIYEPVKNWIVDLFNPGKKDDPTPDPKPDPKPDPEERNYSPDEVIAMCDAAGAGVVVPDIVRVEGTVALGSSLGDHGWGGKFITEGEKDLVFESAKGFSSEESLDGATIVLEGYAELFNGTYKVGYLPASASPTGSAFSPTLLSVTQPGEKEIKAITSIDVNTLYTISVGDSISKKDVVANLEYTDGSIGQVTPDSIDYDTSEAGENKALTVHVGNWEGTTFITVANLPHYTPEEVVALCDQAGDGKVVDGLLRVEGFANNGSAFDEKYGWSGQFVTEGEKKLDFGSVATNKTYQTLDNKFIQVEGYAELYQGAYKVAYLPASASPTGEKYNPVLVSAETKDVTPETVTITSALVVGVDQDLTLRATVGPVGSPQDVEWSIQSGSDYATLSEGVLHGVAAGNVVVRATAVGYQAVYAEATIAVKSDVDPLKAAYEAVLDGDTSSKTFSGVVVGMDGNSFYLQSGEYGMMVYNTPVENIALGKVIEVTSTLKLYNGLPETDSVESAVIKGDGQLPAPAVVASASDLSALKINVLAGVEEAVFKLKTKDWTSSNSSVRFTFTIGGDDITVNFNKNGYNAEKATILNAAQAGDKFILGNLITNAYNPGVKGQANQFSFAGTSSTVEKIVEPAKTIVDAVITSAPTEVALNGSIATSDVKVTVTYEDQSTGDGVVTAVSVDTSTAGEATATVTVEGYTPAEPLTFVVTVSSDVPPTPVEEAIYTLDGTETGGTSGYAEASSITQGGLEWSVVGNTTMNPWRIGGKNLTETDRAVESKAAVSAKDVTKVIVNTGNVTLSKVNSVTLKVGTSQGASDISSISITDGTFANAALEFARPENTSWAGRYFSVVFNVNAGSSNSYIHLNSVVFYALAA